MYVLSESHPIETGMVKKTWLESLQESKSIMKCLTLISLFQMYKEIRQFSLLVSKMENTCWDVLSFRTRRCNSSSRGFLIDFSTRRSLIKEYILLFMISFQTRWTLSQSCFKEVGAAWDLWDVSFYRVNCTSSPITYWNVDSRF